MLEQLFLVETFVKSGQMKNVRLSDFGAEVRLLARGRASGYRAA